MKTHITYKIYNIDEDHLKEYEHHSRGKESRVCFIERRLEGWQSNSFESFEAESQNDTIVETFLNNNQHSN